MRELFYGVYRGAVQNRAIQQLPGVSDENSFQSHFDVLKQDHFDLKNCDSCQLEIIVNGASLEPPFFNEQIEIQKNAFSLQTQTGSITPKDDIISETCENFITYAGVFSKIFSVATNDNRQIIVKLDKIELNTTENGNIEYKEFCTVTDNNTSSKFTQSIVISETQYKLLLTSNNKAQNARIVAIPVKQPSWSLFSFLAYLCSCFGLFRCCWPSHQKRPGTPRPPRDTKGKFFPSVVEADPPTQTNSPLKLQPEDPPSMRSSSS